MIGFPFKSTSRSIELALLISKEGKTGGGGGGGGGSSRYGEHHSIALFLRSRRGREGGGSEGDKFGCVAFVKFLPSVKRKSRPLEVHCAVYYLYLLV